ncbi:MAG: ISAs1 family transposase [Caulobacteraceae bacterium]
MEKFSAFFADVPDPRAANVRHDLLGVMFIAVAALLCGAETCADMADFGQSKRALLEGIVELPHGPPSHDTFSRVFRRLRPEPFEAAFARFTAAFSKPLQGVVAIDGKALRGAYQRGRKTTPLHMVNVWAAEARMAIAQRLAPGRNEVAGVLEALSLLALDGCIVTADALHCRADVAQGILDQGGDYVLALKDNHPGLLRQAKAALDAAPQAAVAATPRLAHDRAETRQALVVALDLPLPGAVAAARITSQRHVEGPVEKRHFILSQMLSSTRLLEVVRDHWGIENQLHWVLDVVFNEDASRSRKDHGPRNLALLRKLALNILRAHPEKASLRRKIKRAGWEDSFLQSLLAHMR